MDGAVRLGWLSHATVHAGRWIAVPAKAIKMRYNKKDIKKQRVQRDSEPDNLQQPRPDSNNISTGTSCRNKTTTALEMG